MLSRRGGVWANARFGVYSALTARCEGGGSSGSSGSSGFFRGPPVLRARQVQEPTGLELSFGEVEPTLWFAHTSSSGRMPEARG